jgi:GxxExxY protein
MEQREDRGNSKGLRERADGLSKRIIGAAIEVHRLLGPGLLESAYEECFARELQVQDVPFKRQIPIPVEYKGTRVEAGYRLDFLIDGLVIVEIKAVERIEPVHKSQLLTYLRLRGLWLGLLINFHSSVLKNGIHRVVN